MSLEQGQRYQWFCEAIQRELILGWIFGTPRAACVVATHECQRPGGAGFGGEIGAFIADTNVLLAQIVADQLPARTVRRKLLRMPTRDAHKGGALGAIGPCLGVVFIMPTND